MIRVALRTLWHERLRALTALFGIAAATSLVLVQVGLYRGFTNKASAVIDAIGGDLWITAEGVQVFDNPDRVHRSAVERIEGHRCTESVTSVVVDYTYMRRPSRTLVSIQMIAVDDASRRARPFPWVLAQGSREKLDEPDTVIVDMLDREVLGILREGGEAPAEPSISVRDYDLRVVGFTDKLKAFALIPYVFASDATARSVLLFPDEESSYFVVRAKSPACVAELKRLVPRAAVALTRAEFAKLTQDYWVENAGIGTILSVGVLLSLLVGGIVLTQTLLNLTRAYLAELAMLKAFGARTSQLGAFVFWQSIALSLVGILAGLAIAFATRELVLRTGLLLTLDALSIGLAAFLTFLMCVGASLASVQRVARVSVESILR